MTETPSTPIPAPTCRHKGCEAQATFTWQLVTTEAPRPYCVEHLGSRARKGGTVVATWQPI